MNRLMTVVSHFIVDRLKWGPEEVTNDEYERLKLNPLLLVAHEYISAERNVCTAFISSSSTSVRYIPPRFLCICSACPFCKPWSQSLGDTEGMACWNCVLNDPFLDLHNLFVDTRSCTRRPVQFAFIVRTAAVQYPAAVVIQKGLASHHQLNSMASHCMLQTALKIDD